MQEAAVIAICAGAGRLEDLTFYYSSSLRILLLIVFGLLFRRLLRLQLRLDKLCSCLDVRLLRQRRQIVSVFLGRGSVADIGHAVVVAVFPCRLLQYGE